MTTMSYLDRFLDPVTDSFTPELARKICELRADDELQAEIETLRTNMELCRPKKMWLTRILLSRWM